MKPAVYILFAAITLLASGCTAYHAVVFGMSEDDTQNAYSWSDKRNAEVDSMSAHDREAWNENEAREGRR